MAVGDAGIARAKEELDGTMGVMRDNMKLLAEREAKLHSLDDKSAALQGTADKFSKRARMVNWKTKLSAAGLAIGAGLVLAWCICWALHVHVHRRNPWSFIAGSLVLALAIWCVWRQFLARRLFGAEEDDDSEGSGSSSSSESA
eukprot:CAMPEP_0115282210 /NCGR_PEP_ID=MMETSP0270-20121206/59721_1 /TAXON_ID=71861 /ORGANISM="Scrippsiella trochoidea, Strain CCMP3099" /LENGTH=143 /DNA_ID=CAMNT_0002699041 /DNA_START=81 /DNA_END=512 /DNA_ORIENTATION=-